MAFEEPAAFALSELLERVTLSGLDRMLSLLDRNPLSPTRGCFYREYWHYKAVTDHPSATWQQLTLALAGLWSEAEGDNPIAGSGEVLDLIGAALGWWCDLQHPDGTFDEWFPHEHSHVATAFTTFGMLESLRLIGKRLPPEIRSKTTAAAERACSWLTDNPDLRVLNHTAGAVAALDRLWALTDDRRWFAAREAQLGVLERHRSEEGWFEEYGGADPGYLGVSLDFLAVVHHRSPSERLARLLRDGYRFLGAASHPDGALGGTYGSRNVTYLLPRGVLLAAREIEEAARLVPRMTKGLGRGTLPDPGGVDDRYFAFFFYPNFVMAAVELRRASRASLRGVVPRPEGADRELPSHSSTLLPVEGNQPAAPSDPPEPHAGQPPAGPEILATGVEAEEAEQPVSEVRYYPDAGLLRAVAAEYEIVVGLSKNGVFRLFVDGALAWDDGGYVGRTAEGGVQVSAWLNRGYGRGRPWLVSDAPGGPVGPGGHRLELPLELTVTAPFARASTDLPLTWAMVPFRMFNLTVGRMGRVAQALTDGVKAARISGVQRCAARLTRRLLLSSSGLRVVDRLDLGRPAELDELQRLWGTSFLHVPSSRMHVPGNLAAPDSFREPLETKGDGTLTVEAEVSRRTGWRVEVGGDRRD